MTYDDRNAKAVASLHPVVAEMANALLRELDSRGEDILITDATRTFDEQKWLYAQGRSKPGKVLTFARPGESLHNYGCAIDFVPVNSKGQLNYADLQGFIRIAAIARTFGFEWGGDWEMKDLPHLQYTGGFSLAEFKSGKAQQALRAPKTPFKMPWYAYAYLTAPEQIKRLQRALQRAPAALVTAIQRRLDRLRGN